MATTFATPTPAVLEMLLADSFGGFTPFTRALDGLDPVDAVRVPDGSPYSVADVVAHMVFWQERFLSLVDGQRPAPVERAADGWPTVTADDWPGLAQRYLAGLARFRALAADEAGLARPLIEGRPMTVGSSVIDYHVHGVHHLGQVILLRRMLGAWPPPGGGDTW